MALRARSWLMSPSVATFPKHPAATIPIKYHYRNSDYRCWASFITPPFPKGRIINTLDMLGLVATTFTTSSFVPQVWRTWKTRDVSGISLPTYVIITFGLALWLVYGLLKDDLPLIVANSMMVVLTGSIAVMKLKFKRPD